MLESLAKLFNRLTFFQRVTQVTNSLIHSLLDCTALQHCRNSLTNINCCLKRVIAANTKCSQLRHIEVFYTQFSLFFTQLPPGRWERVEYTTWAEWPKSILPSPLAVHGPLCPVLLVPCPAPVLHLTRIYRTLQ